MEDMIQGDLSKLVHFDKCGKGGRTIMCEVSDDLWRMDKRRHE